MATLRQCPPKSNHCVSCILSQSISCIDSKIAAVWWSEVYIPVLQEMLKMFPIVLDTFPFLLNVVAHTLWLFSYMGHFKMVNDCAVFFCV